MEKPKNIQDLRKYIPFIDYGASLDEKQYEKLLSIKRWILGNKMYSEDVLEKLKQMIIRKYNELMRKNVKIPKNIMDIFTIDLCSDDEHTEQDSVAPKSSPSSKIVKKKDIEPKENNIDLSDGEIIDSDTDTINTVFKKAISFQISAEPIKVSDKENEYNKNSAKKFDGGPNDTEKKEYTQEFKKHKSTSEINIRKEIEKVLSKEKYTPNIEKEVEVDREDEETEALLNRIDKLCGKIENNNKNKKNESIECLSISDNSIDEMDFELLENKPQPSETTKSENKNEQIKDEEQIFTRRSYKIENDPIVLDDYNLKTKIKKRRKKRLSKTESLKSGQLCDTSSDEDLVALPVPASHIKNQKTETVTFVTLSDTDEVNEKVVNEDIVDCKTKNNLSTMCDDKKWEKLDINELGSIFTKLVKGSNIDLEHFLAEIAKTDNDMNSSPTTSPYYAADNMNMNDYASNMNDYASNEYTSVPTQAFNINGTAMPTEIFYNTSHVQSYQQQFPQMPQYPIMQQASLQPPPAQPSDGANNYPIFYINGQKINLKDPRVRQHLLNLQKPSEPSVAKQMPPNCRFESQSNQTLRNDYASRPSEPMTYLEYKRRKAEKLREAELRKQAENQYNLEKANNTKTKEITTSKSMQTASLCNSNYINESSQAQKTVEAIKYNNPTKTKPEETKKVTKTKERDEQPLSDKIRKSPLLETIETSTSDNSSKKTFNATKISPTNNPTKTKPEETKKFTKTKERDEQPLSDQIRKSPLLETIETFTTGISSKKVSNATKVSPTKNPKKKTRKNSTSRVLKELECTVIGFDKLQDYLPLTLNGKRKSSESARSAIAKQLNGQQLSSECTTPEDQKNKRNRISIRRSSMGHALDKSNSSYESPAPIAKRRKTCTEVSLATLLQDSSSDSAEELTTGPQYLIESSSDTDTFDFDAFNYKKAKAVALKNQPFVLLQRLTENEINKHLRRNRPVPPEQMCLNVKLVEKKTKEAPEYNKPAVTAPKTKPSKNVPNIDVRMTERNTTYCALCKAKPVNLVNHYIRNHKTEPYVSRLTSKELEDLQFNCPFAVLAGPRNARVPKYKVQCLFCADELVDRFINFYTHYSAHTGEYAFQCYNCELKKPYRADIQSHKNQAKSCRKAQIQKLYVYPTNLMVIYLHCCKLCNFVQLNEANVFKHLREQHAKRGDDAIYVQKYIAAAINDAEIVNEFLSEETEFSAREESLENQQESDSELTCSEVDIKPDLSPYSSILDDNYTQSIPIHMTKIPISNLKASYTSSFLDKKVTTNKDDTDVELPRPIIVKSEVKEESHSFTFEQPSNCNATHLHYRCYPQNIPYFGVFKCMAIDCFFSTDAEDEMLQHLNDHGSSECPPTSWLDCSYCQLRHDACCTADDLIAHIKLKHSQSRFQCSLCCYRSCEPSCVIIHCSVVHDSELDTIFMYECEGESKSEKERLPDMMKSMAEHVKKVQCKHCSLGFYAITALRKHLNTAHGILSDDPVLFPEYSCIHCEKDFMFKKDMQEHIALKHPDELAYACKRVPKNPLITGDVIDNLQLCNIGEIAQLTSIRKPLTPAALVQSTCPLPAAEQKENTTKLSSEVCFSNQELNVTDSGIESVATELIDDQRDLKPTPEQLVYIAEETLRALLNKLTSKTGISPDRLYHCPVATCGGFFSTHALWSRHMNSRHNCLITRCPHCPRHLELALSDFEQHFVQHCRHLYVCFHCSETFVNEQAATAHFQAVHSNEPNFHFELIKFNLMHSYRIIISESASAERLEFCQILQDNVVKRLEQVAKEESSQLLSRWLVPASADWLEDYPLSNRNNTKTCIVKSCHYKTRNVEELFQHWEASHNVTGDFKCSRCSLNITNLSSWQPIVEHVYMHDTYYVCSACNYHNFGREQMTTHTLLEHNSRDVPFVSLFHSGEQTHFRSGVIFAASCKTFSTITTCFFCNAKNLSVQTLRKHFKQEHKVSMQHFCEICSIPFKDLSEVDAHHSSSHESSQIKIRCEFVSHLQLLVRSIFPLRIDIISADLIATTKIKQSSDSQLSDCTAKAQATQHNKAPCVDESAQSFATQKRIKQEIPDDGGNGSDSEVEIIEEDDLVCAEEFKARRNEHNKNATISVPQMPRLRVKNLLENNTTSNSPIAGTQKTTVNVPNSITVIPISVQPNESNILQPPTTIDTTAIMQTATQVDSPNFTVTPISVTPISVTPISVTPISVIPISVQPNQSNILNPPTIINSSAIKQTPTQITKTTGTQNGLGNHPLLQQALSNATSSMQQPTQQIQPNNFSSSSNVGSSQQLRKQTIHPQQPVHSQQQIHPNKFSFISNQGSSLQIQQNQQTIHPQQPVLNNQQIRSNEFSYISNQNSSQQQLQQTQHKNVFITTYPENATLNQNQHLSSVPQQIPSNGQQQIQYINSSIFNSTPQTTYPQQSVVKNQQQHFGAVPRQIGPIKQMQQLQNSYKTSPLVQTTPQSISVRLSAPDNRNQRIINPIVQHPRQQTPQISVPNIQPSLGQFGQQNWVPASPLNIDYIATTNNDSSFNDSNFTPQLPQIRSIPQSFNTHSLPHNYFH